MTYIIRLRQLDGYICYVIASQSRWTPVELSLPIAAKCSHRAKIEMPWTLVFGHNAMAGTCFRFEEETD